MCKIFDLWNSLKHPTVLCSLVTGISVQQTGVTGINDNKHLQICKTKQNKKPRQNVSYTKLSGSCWELSETAWSNETLKYWMLPLYRFQIYRPNITLLKNHTQLLIQAADFSILFFLFCFFNFASTLGNYSAACLFVFPDLPCSYNLRRFPSVCHCAYMIYLQIFFYECMLLMVIYLFIS